MLDQLTLPIPILHDTKPMQPSLDRILRTPRPRKHIHALLERSRYRKIVPLPPHNLLMALLIRVSRARRVRTWARFNIDEARDILR